MISELCIKHIRFFFPKNKTVNTVNLIFLQKNTREYANICVLFKIELFILQFI